MIKSIFLFCNKDYGHPYMEVLLNFAKENSDFNYNLIFSLKGTKKCFIRKNLSKINSIIAIDPIYWKTLRKRVKIVLVVDVNDYYFMKTIPKNSALFVAGFNQIFSLDFIRQFGPIINFHPSLLPYYRGAIPAYWVIKNKEVVSGFTAHVISEKIDSGEIIYQEMVRVNKGISESELSKKIALNGSYYFYECLNEIKKGEPFRRELVDPPYEHKIGYSPSKRD